MAEFTPSPLRMSSETRPFLYNLLDNVIGVDDDYRTIGEEAGSKLREDPLGVLKSLYEGGRQSIRDFRGDVKDEGIVTALTDIPLEMSKGMMSSVSRLKGGIEGYKASGLDEGEARDAQLGDVLTASGIAELLPIGKVASVPLSVAALRQVDKGAGSVFDKVTDAKQRAAAEEFGALDMDMPASRLGLFTTPNRSREGTMDDDPQFGVLASGGVRDLSDAESALASGASREFIAENYGIRFIDIRDPSGTLKDRRAGFVSDPNSIKFSFPDKLEGSHKLGDLVSLGLSASERFISNYRPDALDNISVEFRDLTDKGYAGYYDSDADLIVVNSMAPLSEQKKTIRHEMEHMLLDQGGLEDDVLGASPEGMFDFKVGRLNSIEGKIAFHEKRLSDGRGGNVDTASIEDLKEERDALLNRTSFEMYMGNPGEHQARISEGDLTGAKRIPPTQQFNTQINRQAKGSGLLERGVEAGLGALLPESRFVELARKYPAVRKLAYSGRLDPSAFEKHARVSMSADDTRVFSPQYPVTTREDSLLTPSIPFANGGSVASRFTGLGSMGYMI